MVSVQTAGIVKIDIRLIDLEVERCLKKLLGRD